VLSTAIVVGRKGKKCFFVAKLMLFIGWAGQLRPQAAGAGEGFVGGWSEFCYAFLLDSAG
jgi:hypothetical protein